MFWPFLCTVVNTFVNEILFCLQLKLEIIGEYRVPSPFPTSIPASSAALMNLRLVWNKQLKEQSRTHQDWAPLKSLLVSRSRFIWKHRNTSTHLNSSPQPPACPPSNYSAREPAKNQNPRISLTIITFWISTIIVATHPQPTAANNLLSHLPKFLSSEN